jgi:AraC-like DNA-binding protein
LAALAQPDAMLDHLVDVLGTESDLSGDGLHHVAAALELLDTDPAMPVADVADRVGISHGHLNREFSRVVGLTPRAVTRLLRLQHMLGELDVERRIVWTDVAAELGWFDQAHFIRDFKRHTGVTPSDYLAAQRRNYPGAEVGEAAGFVPEGTRRG